jgi:arylsulfatase
VSEKKQPNILFIMDDQHRHDYLGYIGADHVHTPNIDSIAQRGTVFTQAITNCPVCAPARIGLTCGQNPFRVGSVDNQSYLPASQSTYYQRLRDIGYHVGGVGKFDLAKPLLYNGHDGRRPCNYTFGFTLPVEVEGKMHAGCHPAPQGPYGHWLQSRGLYDEFHKDYVARRSNGWVKNSSHDSVLPTDAFADSYIGRRSVEWINEVTDEYPWHLFVSFVGPHDPFDPPTEYADRYRNAEMPAAINDNLTGKPEWVKRRDLDLSAEEIAHTRRQYCASIEVIDDQVGAILEALDHRGMTEETIVIYSSDHGEMLGDHGIYTKTVPYEASIRIPLCMAGQGIPAGESSDALVELIDLNPTICDLAGLPRQEKLDALSLLPMLSGTQNHHREDQLSTIRNFSCLRTQTHKLVLNHNDRTELYNLIADPDELDNCAEREPELVNQLSRRLTARTMEDCWRR